MTTKVLLVGESWVSSATHYKGFDQFGSVTFHLGAEPLVAALKGSEFELTYMPAHQAVEAFPFEMEGLDAYDVIILSDIGANSFLLPPDVWLRSQTVPNRLRLIKAWVERGGGLLMVGGYFSFQGIDGKARWRKTPVEDVLPVTCHPWDDRVEMPEGAVADILQPDHPVLAGLDGDWPFVLGVNEQRPDANRFRHRQHRLQLRQHRPDPRTETAAVGADPLCAGRHAVSLVAPAGARRDASP